LIILRGSRANDDSIVGATMAVDRSRRLVMMGAAVVGSAGLLALGLTEARAAEASAPRPAVPVATAVDQPAIPATPLPPATPAPTVPAPSPGSGSVTVTFVVPPRTFVHLDERGDATEATTNSRRPPAPSDQFFVEGGGPVRSLDPTTAGAVVAAASGDWTEPGRWHSLSGN
jgi:hypothetical protein